jgi:hypothetical protein
MLAIALLPWLVLPFDRLSFVLLLIEFSLLLAYAMPQLRLKERGIWAILTDAGYAYALPSLLAAHTFFLAAGRPENRALAVSLFVWQMALGIRHFLNHLALDRANDIRSGVSTLATIKGSRYIHILIRRAILPIELLGFLGYLLVMNEYAHLLLFVVAAIFIVLSSVHIVLAIGRSYPFLTHRFSKTQLDWLYQVALPLVLLSYLVVLDLRFSALLLAHVLLSASLEKSFRPQLPLPRRPAATGAPNGPSLRQGIDAVRRGPHPADVAERRVNGR